MRSSHLFNEFFIVSSIVESGQPCRTPLSIFRGTVLPTTVSMCDTPLDILGLPLYDKVEQSKDLRLTVKGIYVLVVFMVFIIDQPHVHDFIYVSVSILRRV